MIEEHHGEDEFCTILAGEVGIADKADGSEEIFVAGDSFFLPKGSSLTWVVYETVRKFYMTAEERRRRFFSLERRQGMPAGQLAPVLFVRAARFRLLGRVHFLKDAVGDTLPEPDDDYVVFRKMVLDPSDEQPAEPQAVFKVRFRFAKLSAAANKRLSLIPAPFIAAQPGFRSKTWMLGRNSGAFQGLYEWDSVAEAEAYVMSFPLRLMKRRAVPGSVTYEVAPK